MSTEGLHDTFALLLHQHQHQHHATKTTLSADVARAIRRRVAVRWASHVGALIVVASLGAAALTWPNRADDTPTLVAIPIPTPTIGFAAATFPLTGGPEFVPASAGLQCGDNAPAPRPVDHDLSLTIVQGTSFALGAEALGSRPTVIRAVVKETTASDKGAIATSGVDFLVVQDGIIRGMTGGGGVGLAQNVVGGTVSILQSRLLTDGVYCPDGQQKNPANISPGTYQVVAVGRVFSTPESVALAQALGDTINSMYLHANSQADPAAVYLPGIYNCKQARDWGSALRGCLPEITNDATVDEAARTVTLIYHTTRLVDEFSTVLVSEPLSVDLPTTAQAPGVAAA